MLDCQVGNPHLFRMGAVEISRETYEDWLEYLLPLQQPAGAWTDRVDFDRRW